MKLLASSVSRICGEKGSSDTQIHERGREIPLPTASAY
ncbi:hypothetical protein EMIT0P228_30348 [Pseudomonas brassicacearum]